MVIVVGLKDVTVQTAITGPIIVGSNRTPEIIFQNVNAELTVVEFGGQIRYSLEVGGKPKIAPRVGEFVTATGTDSRTNRPVDLPYLQAERVVTGAEGKDIALFTGPVAIPLVASAEQ
jgi:hypothetical protein